MDKKPTCVPGRYGTVEINEDVCTGCNLCVDICIMDVLAEAPVKGEAPIVAYPEECWLEGCCVEMCPRRREGAITLNIPLPMRASVLKGNAGDAIDGIEQGRLVEEEG